MSEIENGSQDWDDMPDLSEADTSELLDAVLLVAGLGEIAETAEDWQRVAGSAMLLAMELCQRLIAADDGSLDEVSISPTFMSDEEWEKLAEYGEGGIPDDEDR